MSFQKRLKEFEERAIARKMKGESLESLINDLYTIWAEMPAFREELAAQKRLDEAWLKIDTKREFEDIVKRHRMSRLKELPARQLRSIVQLFDGDAFRMTKDSLLGIMSATRDLIALGDLSNTTHPRGKYVWILAVLKQILYIPLEQLKLYIPEVTSRLDAIGSLGTTGRDVLVSHAPHLLNDFLGKVPLFRTGFEASNKSIEAVAEYIKSEIDPELDLIKVCIVGMDDEFKWYNTSRFNLTKNIIGRYAHEKGISLPKSILWKHNGRSLFGSDLKKILRGLGIQDGDKIIMSIRSLPASPQERVPLKQLQEGSNNNKRKVRAKQSKSKGNRSKHNTYTSDDAEFEKLKELHSKAMSSVLVEAERKHLKQIRQRLNDMTLKRMPPKQKNKVPKAAKMVSSTSNPLSDGLAGKAGKLFFIVRVGEPQNLYKSTKKTSSLAQASIDLHGMTKEEALSQLDNILPEWVDTAMKETHPFVMQAKIICGGGSQILSEGVEHWIRDNRFVANAPKNLSF